MFNDELEAIVELRKEFPTVGQRTLAAKIVNRDFVDSRVVDIARRTGGRTYSSIYGVIRRLDNKTKPAVAA